jgi:hypothetical protein
VQTIRGLWVIKTGGGLMGPVRCGLLVPTLEPVHPSGFCPFKSPRVTDSWSSAVVAKDAFESFGLSFRATSRASKRKIIFIIVIPHFLLTML